MGLVGIGNLQNILVVHSFLTTLGFFGLQSYNTYNIG